MTVYIVFSITSAGGKLYDRFCGQGELFRVPELSARTNEYLSYVRLAGQEYASGGISDKTQELLDQLYSQKKPLKPALMQAGGLIRTAQKQERLP